MYTQGVYTARYADLGGRGLLMCRDLSLLPTQYHLSLMSRKEEFIRNQVLQGCQGPHQCHRAVGTGSRVAPGRPLKDIFKGVGSILGDKSCRCSCLHNR